MAVLYPAMEYSEVEVEIERKGEYPNMKKQVKENGKKKNNSRKNEKEAERGRKNTDPISCSYFILYCKERQPGWAARSIAVGERRVKAA